MSFGFGLSFPRAQPASLEAAIAAMFPDVWYDPSDLTTLFQDSAGTTPVTALEQPVGLMKDKSGNNRHAYHTPGDTTTRPTVSRRINLLTKTEDFADAAWLKGAGVTTSKNVTSPLGIANDAWSIYIPNTSNGIYQSVGTTNQPYTTKIWLRAKSGTPQVHMDWGGVGSSTVTLSTTWTEYSAAYTNTTSRTIYVVLRTDSPSSLPSVEIEVWHPSCTATDLSSLPYQRVNTTTDYDSDPSKFPTFLRCDGVNDSLQTNAIDFSGTDKMFVGAGVRKLSDASAAIVAEFSASVNLNTGAFALSSAGWGSAGAKYGCASNPNYIVYADTPTSFAAPTNNTLALILDNAQSTSAGKVKLQVNGSQQSLTIVGTSASGSFGNHKLYLFMRGGTTLPFIGWFYGLQIKAAIPTAAQISVFERYNASKTKTVVLA